MPQSLFGIGQDFLEEFQSLDARFVKNKHSTFFFEAVGAAMSPTILPKEILIVDRSIRMGIDRICIIAYEGELICRRLKKNSRGLWLLADNPQFKKLEVKGFEELILWGVVRAKAGEIY